MEVEDVAHRRKKCLIKAYILITTDVGCQQKVCNESISIPEVKEAYTLQGVFDLIVDIEADDFEYLKETIHRRFRRLDEIRSTITLIERNEENEMRGKYVV